MIKYGYLKPDHPDYIYKKRSYLKNGIKFLKEKQKNQNQFYKGFNATSSISFGK